MAEGKPINILNALVSMGVDPDSAARVQREISREAGQIQSRLDKLNSTKAQKSMELWALATREAGGVQKLTAEQTSRLVYEIERLQKAGAKVPIALQPAIDAMHKLRDAEKAAADQAAKTAAAQEKSAADTAQLKSGVLDKAGLGALAGAGPAAGALLAVGAMAGVAKQTYDLIEAATQHADTVADLATQYQMSTDAVQTFQFMADRTGVSIDAFGGAIVQVTKNLAEAPEKFAKWGMSVEHLRSLRPEELLGAMSEKLKTLSESDRLAFSREIMKTTEVLPALLGGFDELIDKARQLGINLSEADISSLNEMRDGLDDIGTAWDGMWLQLGAALAQDQDVQDLFKNFRDGIIWLAGAIKDNKSEIVNFAKLLTAMATFNPFLGAKAVRGLVNGSEPPTYEWGTDPTVKPSQRVDVEALAAARKKAEAERKKALAEELKDIETRDEAYRKHLESMKAVIDGEAAMWLQLEARLALDNKGSMLDDKAPFAAYDRWNPRGDKITDTAGPALDDATMVREARNALMRADADKEKQLRLNKAVEESLRAQGKSEAEISRIMGTTVAQTMTWSQFLQTAANQLSAMGRSGQAIGKILGGVGGIGAMFEQGGALNGVKGIGDLFKGGTGQVLGKLAGGATAALAAFDIGKTLYSMFHKTEAQKVAFDVGRDYGVKISEGLSKEIAEKSKTIGREAASLLSLDKIVAEGGGVQAFGVDKTTAKMRDLFSMIQTGKATTTEAKVPFDKLFGEVAQASISKTTGLISLQVKELMALNASSGMGSDAVTKFRNEQRAIADTILTRLANNKGFQVANAQAGEALGTALAAQYKRYLDEGLSGFEIAEKLSPQIDLLQKKLDESGFGGGEVFDAMLGKVDLFRSEITGPTAQALQDVISLSAALYNSGDLTKTQFQGLAGQVGAQFVELQAKMAEAGREPAEAFDMMAADLQKLWEMQRLYNVELDDTTKKMLEDAEAQGKVGKERMSAEDRMAEGIEYLGDVMKRVGESLGATFDDLPSRARKAAEGVGAALDSIRPPDLQMTGGLNLSRDMSPYEAGSGVSGGGLEKAIADLAESAGEGFSSTGIGDAINPGLQAVGEGLAGLAGGTQTITTTVVLSNGAIVGSVRDSVDRNTPEAAAMITAIAEKIKNRNGG